MPLDYALRSTFYRPAADLAARVNVFIPVSCLVMLLLRDLAEPDIDPLMQTPLLCVVAHRPARGRK